MRYLYPAVFTFDRVKRMYRADFPDVPGCHAVGRTMDDVLESARISLGRTLLELEESQSYFPPASDMTLLRLQNRGCTICAVLADTGLQRMERAERMAEASSWNVQEKARRESYGRKLAHVLGIKA
jgi:predicted RNase H-like HicB family nuclease